MTLARLIPLSKLRWSIFRRMKQRTDLVSTLDAVAIQGHIFALEQQLG